MGWLDRMRAKQTPVGARENLPPDLREGRPEAVDRRGLECERCGAETSAEAIECVHGGYWLCPACARLFKRGAR